MYKRMLGCLVVLVLGLAISPTPLPAAAAPAGGPYTLTWVTVDGGGGLSSGGPYDVYLTIGQPDAWSPACGDALLSGGFWNALNNTAVCWQYMPQVTR